MIIPFLLQGRFMPYGTSNVPAIGWYIFLGTIVLIIFLAYNEKDVDEKGERR
jgi:hypothetical protein